MRKYIMTSNNRLEIIESQVDFQRAMRAIEKEKEISFDCETSGLNPFDPDAYITSLGIGTLTKDWTFVLNHYKGKLYKDFKTQRTRALEINDRLGRLKKIAHNGKFDALFLKKLYGFWWFVDFDTMLAHYNLNENERHGLKDLSMRFFGDEGYDIPVDWKQGKAGSLEDHCIYLGKDLYYTTRLKRIFLKQFKDEPNAYRLFTNLTMPLSTLYTKIEERGVPINDERLEESRDYWQEQLDRSHKELKRYSKDWCPPPNKKGKTPEPNFSSPQQLVGLLFNYLKLKPLDKTPKGAYSTSESVLKRLNHPICKAILDNREANKNLSTFIESWKSRMDKVGRIHPTFKIHGTVTGRPSCEEPNLQQTPRDPRIRSIIDAPKGWVLVEADYSQAELRLTADVSGEPTLLETYRVGGDVHTLTVQRIFGIMKPSDDERKKAKAINFGFIYGMWWKKFIIYARDNYGVTFSEKEAENIRKKFFQTYQLEAWHNKQKRLARAQGYVMNKIGRKRRLPNAMKPDRGQYDPQKSEAERQAINSPIQSLASDLNLLAAIEIDSKIDNNICQMVGTVHDCILILIKEGYVQETIARIKQIMESPEKLKTVFKCSFKVPILAEFKIGPWSKGKKYNI